ncbi:MAG TPA: hypothetical protein VFO79_12985, partial [Xanthomonadales bacterium]|nr:hypothetical protein [Xanthomonadales bacterium]
VAAGAMRADALHAELAQIVAQERPGRSSDDEIFVFDSTGTAIEDLAAASMLYQRAWLDPGAIRIDLNAIAPE